MWKVGLSYLRFSPQTYTTALEHRLLARLFKGRRQSNGAQDPRLEVVLPLLGERCRTLYAKYDAPRRYADEMQKVTRELESISQTLSADLVKYIGITFKATWGERDHL
ncbi:hypothetical protein BKA82DRAFT_768560 [Pisolithus tinctorius]|uniref:Uncharacterized protein n=1 Tax=Pisolithus tinctorius Marx 270 TaxID=870435 RepID=A0A0C3NYS3_PISTI|nr:hypothetical protein BKA82DRAFT_768560 [Pisolithus tinctorius]KIO00289.1 hypothetical protein M404DRAFT_768560 [Pisolithus tinctorius Marx 270]